MKVDDKSSIIGLITGLPTWPQRSAFHWFQSHPPCTPTTNPEQGSSCVSRALASRRHGEEGKLYPPGPGSSPGQDLGIQPSPQFVVPAVSAPHPLESLPPESRIQSGRTKC